MFIYSEKATKFCEIFPLLLSYVRSATAIKASKAQALPKFWVAVNPISTRGADYAHHSTMGLVWLKFAAALLYVVPVKSKGKISQNFVAFSEYMNLKCSWHSNIFK